MSDSKHLLGAMHILGLPDKFSRVSVTPYCHRVQMYECIQNNSTSEETSSSKTQIKSTQDEKLTKNGSRESKYLENDLLSDFKQEKKIVIEKFNPDEWKLKRRRQKSMNLIGVDEKTRKILSQTGTENSQEKDFVVVRTWAQPTALPKVDQKYVPTNVKTKIDNKIKEKTPPIREDDPIVKIRERVKLIQEQVEKVREKVEESRTENKAHHVELRRKSGNFDMESWKREREKIRSSRVFVDIDLKPYERKQFEDVSIRPSYETRHTEVKQEEPPSPPIIPEVPKPIPEPVVTSQEKPTDEPSSSNVKFDRSNLHRAKSIHHHDAQKLRAESRKGSLPTIIPNEADSKFIAAYKKKAKKDISWMIPPTEGVASEDEVATLRNWINGILEASSNPDPLEGFECSLNQSKRPSKIILSKMMDPYTNLFGENYTVESVESDTHVTSESVSGLSDACEFKYGKGKGEITFENGDKFFGEYCKGRRLGMGKLIFAEGPIHFVEGYYNNDILEGKGKITYRNGEVLHTFFEDNYCNGYTKLFSKTGELMRISKFIRGIMSGLQWNFLPGGGFTVGKVDMSGILSGEEVAFIYPDLRTAIMGTFVNGKMLIGQTCFLRGVVMEDLLLRPTFTIGSGPQISFDPGNKEYICLNPLLPDPYEFAWVYVKHSRMKGAAEGLFAKQNIPKDRVVSFYNGIRMKTDEMTEPKEDYEGNAYKIMDLLGPDEEGREGILDITPNYRSLKSYCASLAHKTNHSFDPNAKFGLFDHPRFGKVPAVQTMRDIEKDEEISVSYDYALEDAPSWYQELYGQRILSFYQASKTAEDL